MRFPKKRPSRRSSHRSAEAVKTTGCNRAILVGHNAAFDLGFIKAAVERTEFKRNPFHAFSVFDTVSLAGLAYGQTVLAARAQMAGLGWENSEAHTADLRRGADREAVLPHRQPLAGAGPGPPVGVRRAGRPLSLVGTANQPTDISPRRIRPFLAAALLHHWP